MGRYSSPNPAGFFEVSDPDGPGVRGETLQCVHCGCHWHIQPGSGKTRGFCMKCNGPVCGPNCAECVPQEKMMDILEGLVNPTAVTAIRGGNVTASGIWTP